ncbi:MAG: hypothetical protein H7Z16_09220 [Pyrinomonadaceae bacterium]|nr:hypothetical protein [Pyrinomonadaceae bacterium]
MYPNPPHHNQSSGPQLARHSIIDPQNRGMTVSSFVHPSEWQAHSQVVWNMQHTTQPALVHAVTFNPNSMECFEFLPMEAFFWLETDYGTVPIGQNSRGQVRMPPRPAPEALASLVIPHLRGDRQNFRVTGVQPMQNLWQLFKDPPPPNGECVMARVEYEMQGRAIEEEFYGVYSWNQGMQLNWGFGRLFCFRAERGQLNAVRETFWQIAASFQPNPQWGQRYDETVQQLMAGFQVGIDATYARLEGERQIGIANLAYNAQLREQRNAQVEASIAQTRQQIDERSQYHYTPQDAFGDALMGRTAYQDPNSEYGNPHYVEGNPLNVKTDGRGNFRTSDDPTYNPGDKEDGDWFDATEIKPSR